MAISRAPLSAFLTITMVLAAGVLTACGEEELDLPEPAPPPTTAPAESPTPDLTVDEQQAVADVQDLFEDFMLAYQGILVAGDPATDPVLEQLPPRASPLSRLVDDEIYQNYEHDYRAEGSLASEFLGVVEVDLENTVEAGGEESTVPLVRLSYCVDAIDWQPADKITGQPIEPAAWQLVQAPGERRPVTVSAFFFDPSPVEPRNNPVWLLAEWEEAGQSC